MEKIIKIFKWPLVVFILLCFVVFYYNLTSMIGDTLVTPLDRYLHSLGYSFSIEKPLFWILDFMLPAMVLVKYAVNISSDNFKTNISVFYKQITFPQLIILTILLPISIFFENKLFTNLIKTFNLNQELKTP